MVSITQTPAGVIVIRRGSRVSGGGNVTDRGIRLNTPTSIRFGLVPNYVYTDRSEIFAAIDSSIPCDAEVI